MNQDDSLNLYKRPQSPFSTKEQAVFAQYCFQYLADPVLVKNKRLIRTPHGRIPVDFCFKLKNRRIGIQCSELKEELFDAVLLGYEYLDTVYHFRKQDILSFPIDCIWLMYTLDPQFFSDRTAPSLNRDHELDLKIRGMSISLNSYNTSIDFRAFRLTRTSGDYKRELWYSLYQRALEHPELTVRKLAKQLNSNWQK